jgi:hypothetical protein
VITGKHLKIVNMGDNVMGVKLEGDKRRPEPIHFRVCFPGGDVDVVRTTDGQYWVHIRVDHEQGGMFIKGEDQEARIVDARLDIFGKHAKDVNVGDFKDPNLYHMAVRVAKDGW